MELGSRAAYEHVESPDGITAGFMVLEEDVQRLPRLEGLEVQNFKPAGGTAFVKFRVISWSRIPDEIIRFNERGIRAENIRIKEKNLGAIRTDSASTNDALKHAVVAGLGVEELPKAEIGVELIVCNIGWSSNNWKGPSHILAEQIDPRTGRTPLESWNFDLANRRNPSDKVFGYAWRLIQTRLTGNNNLVIFHSDGKVVGFYGRAEVLNKPVELSGGQAYNLIADRSLTVVLNNKLDAVQAKGYLEEKKRVGDNGFIYLKEPSTALRMIAEAIAKNPDQYDELDRLRDWILTSSSNGHSVTDHVITQDEEDHKVELPLQNKEEMLNTILYGPPGTGKTYSTTDMAVALIEGKAVETIGKEPREVIKSRYEGYRQKGQIRMVTFHQSFSYEDFVEGIKPSTRTIERDEVSSSQVSYEVQDGVFKQICLSARTASSASSIHEALITLSNVSFFKVSLGQYTDPADDVIYSYCLENNVIAVGYGKEVDVTGALNEDEIRNKLTLAGYTGEESIDYTVRVLRDLALGMKIGDLVFVSAGNSVVRAIGRITGTYSVDPSAPIRYKQFRKVEWLLRDVEIPVDDLYPKSFVQGTLYNLDRKLVKTSKLEQLLGKRDPQGEKYVLIIDEINRGNVSGIFGELITLIEPDKRSDCGESATTLLPYSKQPFSVPPNLHIIGTMNTADRSVEALDTALRRRFSFIECPSRPELLRAKKIGTIDLEQLLTTINARIEMLLDRDHHIGHSYFMNWDGTDPELQLRTVFRNNIIPLLQEYFYGDPVKIGLVLGEGFIQPAANTNVKLAKFPGGDDIEPKPRYQILDPLESSNDGYRVPLSAFHQIIA